MAAAWERGEPIAAEAWIARLPGLDAETAVRLIYEEVCLRREAGEEVGSAEVIGRFPQWREELDVLFGCDRLLQPRAGATAVFPEVGETLGTFRLLAELGRGASGRTFLATEPTLADRPVILKVSSCDHDEHLTLARLQHTHIVPLFSEQSFPGRGLRSLCMPYLGGASLGQILSELAGLPHGRRRGRHLVEALDRSRSGPSFPSPTDSPYRRFLEQASYVQAICWIVACLADALHYAHTRGLVHMDLKPSNVLIADDGQPLLLDFHLARGPLSPGEWVADRLGGSPGWMSPEQSSAMDAVRLGRPVAEALDGRSDLYALGLLLREALAGPVATSGGGEDIDDRARLRRNPEVSVGLADLVHKCLARQPSGRHRDAAALAEDLRRHLNDLPLRGVANRSPIERWRKWRRRRPGVLARRLAWGGMVAALAVAAVLTGSVYHQRTGEIRTALEVGRTFCARRQYAEAVPVLKGALERTLPLPASPPLTRALSRQLRIARRGQKADSLHELADLIRFRYGLELPADQEAQALVRHCRAIWGERESLLPPGDGAGRLDPESEQRIRTDLLELAVVWADLRVRLAPPEEAPSARRDALRVLDEAEASFGSSPALDRRRLGLAPAPDATAIATPPGPAPRSAWDHYDLGRSELRAGQVAAAEAEFRRVLEERPQDFWSNFYQGLCAFQLHRFEEAVAAFRTCIALSPDAAPCYYNRALAHESLGRGDRAFADYSHALALDPTLTAARLNRGILLHRQGRFRDAILEYQQALRDAAGPEDLRRVHYNLALAHQAQARRPSAEAPDPRSAVGRAESTPIPGR
jgi:serine/threonine protein kinase/tetratricopeptide (TPR) repeat protein